MSDKEGAGDATDTGEKRKRGRPRKPESETVRPPPLSLSLSLSLSSQSWTPIDPQTLGVSREKQAPPQPSQPVVDETGMVQST